MTISTLTVNNVDYSAYVSIVEADMYFSLDPDHPWNSVADDSKKIYLVNSTRRIDLLRYKSVKEVETQALKFPRKDFGLPEDIELATIFLANIIREDPTQAFVASSNARVSRVKAGPVDIEFYPTSDIEFTNTENSIVDPTVRALLVPYLAVGLPIDDSVATGVGVAYGTGVRSSFEYINKYNRYDTNY